MLVLPHQKLHLKCGPMSQRCQVESFTKLGLHDLGLQLGPSPGGQCLHRFRFAVHQGHSGTPLEPPVPIHQPILIGMRRETADGMHLSLYLNWLTPQMNFLCAIHQGPSPGPSRLKPDDQNMRLLSPGIVFEMVDNAATCAHPAAGNHDGTGIHLVDLHGLCRVPTHGHVGHIERIADLL